MAPLTQRAVMSDLWTPAVRAIVVVALLLATSALVLVALATARAAGIGPCGARAGEWPLAGAASRLPGACGPDCVILTFRCDPEG